MSAVAVVLAGRTVADVAQAIGHDAGAARHLLGLLPADGLVCKVEPGRWALTPRAEASYGQAFRNLGTSR